MPDSRQDRPLSEVVAELRRLSTARSYPGMSPHEQDLADCAFISCVDDNLSRLCDELERLQREIELVDEDRNVASLLANDAEAKLAVHERIREIKRTRKEEDNGP